jgi:hypothetical protein
MTAATQVSATLADTIRLAVSRRVSPPCLKRASRPAVFSLRQTPHPLRIGGGFACAPWARPGSIKGGTPPGVRYFHRPLRAGNSNPDLGVVSGFGGY